MSEEPTEWVEVKPRRQTTKERLEEPQSPRSPRARAQSFTDHAEVSGKSRIGKHARRESKLEWSATKRRERDIRVEKRNIQREANKERQSSQEQD